MVYVYTMEYYSAFERKEVLTCATTWMCLEDTVLSEISQPRKDNNVSPQMGGSQRSQILRDRKNDGCQEMGNIF